MAKNEDCKITDSVLCKWLDKNCKDCYVHTLKESDEANEVLNNFQVTLGLLPSDFDELQSEDCCFCKGEKNPRAGYAIVDLAHSEPAQMKGMFFGFGKKVRQRIGSMMPVSISICRRCRTSLRLVEGFKWLGVVVLGGIATGLMVIEPIANAVTAVSPALPIGIVLVAAAAGYFLGKLLSSSYIKANSQRMAFNVFDIPTVAEMKDRGWFTMQDDGEVTRMLFSHKPYTRKLSDVGYAPGAQYAPEERAPEEEQKTD